MNLLILPSILDNIIILKDFTTDYKDENNDLLQFDGTFRYIDLMSVDIILYHTLDNKIEIEDIQFINHAIKDKRITYIDLDKDGYFTILHMELPTKLFIRDACNLGNNRVIYTDGKYFYERYLGYEDKLPVLDLINLTKVLNNYIFNYTIFNHISTYWIHNYYVANFIDNLTTCQNPDNLILLRNYLDVITYLNDHHLENEAGRLILKIYKCFDIYDANRDSCKCGTKAKVY